VKYTEESQILIRNILDGICPVMGVSHNLLESITCLASRLEAVAKVRCKVDVRPDIKLENVNINNHLFMITQEAVNNAVKHSGCTDIRIKIYKENQHICILISDNGEGIGMRENKEGYGFRIMHYRASVIGASLEIKSNKPNGTQVLLKL
jgi:signal transduction histidine kinase